MIQKCHSMWTVLLTVDGVARKFERWGKCSIFPISGRGHVGVVTWAWSYGRGQTLCGHKFFNLFIYFLFLFLLSDFIVLFDIK